MLRRRDPEQTRQELLEAAAEEIYQGGFQAVSLGRILERTGVTKGALYHHFPNKLALGYAVVEEVIRSHMVAAWVKPLAQAEDPVGELIRVIGEQKAAMADQIVRYGCPLNNLAQEMAPADEGFRSRIDEVFHLWLGSITAALRRGQEGGRVRCTVDAEEAALFIVAAIEGCISAAKCTQSEAILTACINGLFDYLQTLRNHEHD